MDKNKVAILVLPFLFFPLTLLSQDTVRKVSDTITLKGQASIWANYNFDNSLPLQTGLRYIPSLNYGIRFKDKSNIDIEGSANIFGSLNTRPFEPINTGSSITPYRTWVRYSTSQTEIRIGLQKINFGSATLLRPLMWFDQIDPRDPLQLTNGVWGLLGRYYFLNNANVWLWCLYGNDKLRPWDTGTTTRRIPEFGGRVQVPVIKGEIALTYHFRKTDMIDYGYINASDSRIPENRIGIDGKWDLGIGLWFEGTWINKSADVGSLTNQEIFNIGTDNTIPAGNGLHIVFEQLFASNDKYPFEFRNKIFFSGLSLSYPVSLNDNLSAIMYYDWENADSYNFINWNHNFKYLSLFLIAYLNPRKYNLPQQNSAGNLYAGPGVQLMLVYNH
jgi:hypothetical protein